MPDPDMGIALGPGSIDEARRIARACPWCGGPLTHLSGSLHDCARCCRTVDLVPVPDIGPRPDQPHCLAEKRRRYPDRTRCIAAQERRTT